MGSLEQKQTVEWTLLKVGVKRWSFVRCFTMKKQLFVHQHILIVKSERVTRIPALENFHQLPFFTVMVSLRVSKQRTISYKDKGKTDLNDKKAQFLLARPVNVCM